MKVSQGLEFAKAKAMSPITMKTFYSNLLQLYNTYGYTPSYIWNLDESECNASKSGLSKVLGRKGTRHVHAHIFNEKEWLSMLTSINVACGSILHFFIFKGKRRV